MQSALHHYISHNLIFFCNQLIIQTIPSKEERFYISSHEDYPLWYFWLKGHFPDEQPALIRHRVVRIVRWLEFFFPQSSLARALLIGSPLMMSNHAYYVIGGEFGLSARTAEIYMKYLFCIFPANKERGERGGRHIPGCDHLPSAL